MDLKERVKEIMRILDITPTKTRFAQVEEVLRADRNETLAYCAMLVITFADSATTESIMELSDELTEACRDIAVGIGSTDVDKDLRAETEAEYNARDLDPDEFMGESSDEDEDGDGDDDAVVSDDEVGDGDPF